DVFSAMLPMSIYIFVCLVFVSWKIHPRLLAWITQARSVGRYFWRCLALLAICLAIFIGIFMAMGFPIIIMALAGMHEAAKFYPFVAMILSGPVYAEFGLLSLVIVSS